MVRYFFSPVSVILLIFLIAAAIFLIPLLFLGLIGSALAKLGFNIFWIILLIIGMIVGSFVNLPLMKVKSEQQFVRVEHGRLMDRLYKVPEFSNETMIAVNVGGCVIPVFVSIYILLSALTIADADPMGLYLRCLIATAIVAVAVFKTSTPIAGLGVATGFLIPPLCALICAIILSGGDSFTAVAVAYISGTVGTLIGADVMNIGNLSNSGAPVASIGGAGTFDAIFLSGIIAAFLA
ncbi:MAG: DUF1614 domain-containing protein [Methanomicrobium sp.]|nr:DUF1614 domain-containing protein [Methanomicrobium sp.]